MTESSLASTPEDNPDGADLTTPEQRDFIETLFRTYYKRLCVYAMRKGAESFHDAEDAVQTAFDRLLEGHQCLSDPVGPDAVLKYVRSTIGGLISNLRRDTGVDYRNREHYTDAVLAIVGPSPVAAPDAMFADLEPEQLIEIAMAKLPGQQRRTVILTRQGNTYAQVAKILNISPRTVCNHVVRGLEQLRREVRRLLDSDVSGDEPKTAT